MAQKLSKRILDSALAEADPASDVLLYDSTLPGFAVRLRGGRAAFIYRYKLRGRTQRITIGAYGALTLEQGRDLARDLYTELRRGGDPAESRRESRERGATFADVAALYLADLRERAATGAKRGRRSTVGEFARLLDRCILPRIGRREIGTLDLAPVEAMHRAMAATPAQANRALTVTSAVLGFAERRGLRPRGSNPCPSVVLFEERGRRERLSLAELARLGEALREAESKGTENPSALLAVRLLALTGMRRSEVLGHGTEARRTAEAGLRWKDVDLDGKTLRLRDAKAGARTVPLGAAAVKLLKAARPADANPEGFVCPGARPGGAFVGVDKVRRRLYAKAGITGRDLHSLRHTFSSVAADAGLGEYIIAGLLGHRGGGMTSRYVHPDRDPLHQAAEAVSRTIAAALAGKSGDVVPIRPIRREA